MTISPNNSLSIAFVSHGGGPMPLLGDPSHDALVHSLQDMAHHMPRPSAIVVVSAHWEQTQPTVTTSPQPALIYDYGGFPPESYAITYPAPGSPTLAARAIHTLNTHGLHAQEDPQRGFDHGMFVPLKLMYPQADIPCIQLSLCHDLNPAKHLAMGQALRTLADNATPEAPLLLLGSGFSFHNMRAFFSAPTPDTQALNHSFEQWLHDTCCDAALSDADRHERLLHWAQAPGARYCHPREEHLLPLHVCVGAAQGAARKAWRFEVLGQQASAYLW